MNEAKKTTLFGKWAKAHKKKTFVFEAKISKKPYLSFKAVKTHQKKSLFQSSFGSFFFKIPDSGYQQMPFDGFFLYKVDAFVVIFWYLNKGDNRMTIISIDNWIKEERKSIRKSITYDRACEIADLCTNL